MQVTLTRTAIDEVAALIRGWVETSAPEEKLQKQAAFAKAVLKDGLGAEAKHRRKSPC